MLWQLHWLRVVFKIEELVRQLLIRAASVYLADNCHLLLYVGHHLLPSNSNDMRKLLVTRTHNKLGNRKFSLLIFNCETIFRPYYSDWDCSSTPSDNLRNLICLATEVLSGSIEFIDAIQLIVSVYLLWV